jgi:phage tail sheath gpL-like
VSRSPDLAKYPDGIEVTLTANPDADWGFQGWSGDAAGHCNPLVLAMTADLAVTATFYRLADRAATSASCVLTGTPHAGEDWTVHWAGADSTHTVTDCETLPDIADALALSLDAHPDTCAGSEGTAFAVIDLSGAPIDLSLSVASAGSAIVDETTAVTKLVTLTGTLAVENTWTLTVDGTPLSHTVQAMEDLYDIADALASQIDGLPGYVCRSHESVLIASSVLGGALDITSSLPDECFAEVESGTTTTKVVTFAGSVNPPDVWCVDLDGETASHVAEVGDTTTTVALALASALGEIPGFSVSSEGSLVAIVEESLDGFALSASVTPTGNGSIDATTPTAVLLIPDGEVVPGETWTLRLDGVDYAYIVQAGDTAATLAAELTLLVDASAGLIASSEAATIAICSPGGAVLEASLHVTVP